MDNLRAAIKCYHLTFELDAKKDGSIGTDFTFVNMSKSDLLKANSKKIDLFQRKVLQFVLPMCFFPEKVKNYENLRGDLDRLRAFLDTEPGSEAITVGYRDYKSYVARRTKMMSHVSPEVKKDAFLMSKTEQVGTTILESAASPGNSSKVKQQEQELLSVTQLIESFHADPSMRDFYLGFSRTFTSIHTSSHAIHSGTIAVSTDNLAVTAGAFLLSMVPLIGNTAQTVLETGYEKYTETKLQNNASMMVSRFPMNVLMNEAVLKALSKVHTDKLKELRELDASSDAIMEGLLDKLVGKLESLKSIICAQHEENEMEKLAAQVAMDVIQQHIFSGKIPSKALPSAIAEQLTHATLQSVSTVHAQREALLQKHQQRKSKQHLTLAPVPPVKVSKSAAASASACTPTTQPSTPVRPPELVDQGCQCTVS